MLTLTLPWPPRILSPNARPAHCKQFGLSQTTVSRIRRGQSHKGVA